MSSVLKELRPTLALAVPIIVGQVGQMLMGITDSVMIGRVGKVPLAASAFAGSIFNLVFLVGLGLLLAVSVLTARAHGARQARDCAEYLRHGLVLALGLGLGTVLLLGGLATQLEHFGQPREVLAAVNPFFVIISLSLLPAFLFQVLKQFSEAVGHPWAPMVILLGCVGLNVVLNWLLIYGHGGLPALGLAGSGWATLISRVVAVLLLWAWLAHRTEVRREWPGAPAGEGPAGQSAGRSESNPAWSAPMSAVRFRAMLAIGLPAAGQWLFEVGAFSAAAIMMGWIGTAALAAHQIALSCTGFTFMFPLGLSVATSLRVGKAVGRGGGPVLRAIGLGAVATGVVAMAAFAVVFALAGRAIAAGFSADADVVALATRLFLVAAVFQVVDGAQVIAAGALRGLADVKVPTLITFVAYWVVALPAGYLLAFAGGAGAVGIWSGLAAGLALAALLLVGRFHRLTHRALSHR